MKNALLVSLSGASLECRKEGGETQGEGEEKISTLVMFLTKGGGSKDFVRLCNRCTILTTFFIVCCISRHSSDLCVHSDIGLCVRVPTDYVFVYRRTMCSCTDELCVHCTK